MRCLDPRPDDNCRVYWKADNGALYCWQNDGYGREQLWQFYRCSRDGEPSHQVTPPEGVNPPLN